LDETTPIEPAPPPAEAAPPAPAAPPFPLPGAYYATPPGDRPPLMAAWVPRGCGIAALVALLVLFGLGYAAGHGALAGIMPWVIGNAKGEIEGAFTADVTPQQKKDFSAAMDDLTARMKTQKLSPEQLQGLLREVRDSVMDQKVDARETARLTAAARAASAGMRARGRP
jgi:hypothetical protein